ncbi:S66 peptidase family protein [Bryocella elongata]|uniref:S66 peptidase family protein n=1 Tax=Bryocella elongata TaxID=863522 RepID=UPI001F2EDF72|nr:LD-carboxypeptidase [Bryocella elongata]
MAIVSPASYAQPELIDRGVARLRAFGYEPVVMPNARERGPLYYAGTAEQRVADLHAAYTDESIGAIVCTRGGWGSAELLPLLDPEIVRTNPKPFIGYSDHTSLHAWMWNECGLPTVYGAMVASDWAKDDGVDEPTWLTAVEGAAPWSVDASDGIRVLCEGAAVEGRLLGGCLSILCEALGTPYALQIEEPCILFCEDIGTKPYKWDRLLQHWKFAGMMENVRGIVLGDMSANVEPQEMALLEGACLHALRHFEGPITIGLKCGHLDRQNRSTPLGAWVGMDGASLREK